jgi:hypothetical protein
MINPNFVYLGMLFQFAGGMSYLIDTVKGKIQPNRVSWTLFVLAPALAFFAQLQQGVGMEIWATFIVCATAYSDSNFCEQKSSLGT